ncbi:hypothetical protein [Vibrio sp. 16]|uniref:hypothetical protein n=1 Tax=Vibrio sp. 16 TaxID=391586 RepID=UPI00018F2BC2|nr:hypothetical protein [Vibrio sp. 16]EED28629.1 conserved hypothetical protein [Vibrio sp. 16]CAK4074978.1 hypothetical protein VDT1_3721 [Vibrio sp. 16]
MIHRLITLLTLVVSFNAYSIPTPQGEPILWVNGNLSQLNTGDGVVFDEQMLQALDIQSIKTSNHVVSQAVEYRGPTIKSLLDYVGAKGTHVRITAWDDYVVRIAVSDIEKYGVLLATHEAGNKMTLDDKGPLFVVFPFSEYPELRNDFYYSLSAWQVKEVFVE